MILALAAAMAMQSNVPNTWQMGGGRVRMNLPGGAYCQSYKWSCLDPRIRESKNGQEAWLREVKRIEGRAQSGDVRAMRMIGVTKLKGLGVPQDQAAGLGWIYEAAIRGDPLSMHILGRAFEEGVGVAADQKLAAFWLKRAADHGVLAKSR